MKRSFEHEVCCAYEAASGTESSASLHRDGDSASYELLASASFNKKNPCALAQGHKNLKLFFKLILGLAELNAAEYDTVIATLAAAGLGALIGIVFSGIQFGETEY